MSARDVGGSAGQPPCPSEETVADYEALERLAREATQRLRTGDWDRFAALIATKRELITRIKDASGREAHAAAGLEAGLRQRAERSLTALLEEEAKALSLLVGLRDEVERSLAEVARGDAGLRSYRTGAGARVLDQRI